MRRFRRGEWFDQNGIRGTVLGTVPRYSPDGDTVIGETVTVVGRTTAAGSKGE